MSRILYAKYLNLNCVLHLVTVQGVALIALKKDVKIIRDKARSDCFYYCKQQWATFYQLLIYINIITQNAYTDLIYTIVLILSMYLLYSINLYLRIYIFALILKRKKQKKEGEWFSLSVMLIKRRK